MSNPSNQPPSDAGEPRRFDTPLNTSHFDTPSFDAAGSFAPSHLERQLAENLAQSLLEQAQARAIRKAALRA